MIEDAARVLHALNYAQHVRNTIARKRNREHELDNLDVSIQAANSALGTRITTSPSPDGVFRAMLRLEALRDRYAQDLEMYAETIERFTRDLDNLVPEEAQVLTLRYMQDYEYREIADAMNYSERTVYRIREAALRHLYEFMPEKYRRDTPDAEDVS